MFTATGLAAAAIVLLMIGAAMVIIGQPEGRKDVKALQAAAIAMIAAIATYPLGHSLAFGIALGFMLTELVLAAFHYLQGGPRSRVFYVGERVAYDFDGYSKLGTVTEIYSDYLVYVKFDGIDDHSELGTLMYLELLKRVDGEDSGQIKTSY